MASVTSSWSVRTPGGRYDVMFRHNTFTGRRTLWLDNRVIFQSGLRYRLIGSVGFVLADGSPALVTICAGPRLELVYELVVNGERVPHGDPAKGTMWSFTLRDGPDAGPGGKAESGGSGAAAASGARAGPDGAAPGEVETAPPLTSCDTAGCRVEVEFDHSTYDVLVNRRVVSAEAEFLEEGEGSAFTVPLFGGQTCQVLAKVGPKGTCVPELVYQGERVPSVEEQGADAAETSEALLVASGVRAT
ncbi:hypothetical protein FNF27_01961 [Cafeteria roenbergensis]|uniref:Uncharacterized protein n=2 Tax=Cafeteria roenbergensis TaxID=33653 RepID=A0A5A8EL55_CAFRO|nr:hypothetical protein FNF27_01961 [Cafeteria roenbergensis]